MSDKLPSKSWKKESLIMNLDSSKGRGTHWVCYKKCGKWVKVFNSLGNELPPKALTKYLPGFRITYNQSRFQDLRTSCCGQLCLLFLANQSLETRSKMGLDFGKSQFIGKSCFSQK